MNLKKETIILLITGIIFTLIFFYAVLGIAGTMAILGIVLLFVFPTYTILNNFKLDTDEKLVLSFFIGIGIFPSITYWIGTIISLKLSIFITLTLILTIGYLIKKIHKK